MRQGDDFTRHIMALSAKSTYREKFEDESFILRHPASSIQHPGPGILSTANAEPNTNDSQLCICKRGVWEGERRHEHGFESRNGKSSKKITVCQLRETLILSTFVLPTHQTILPAAQESAHSPSACNTPHNLCSQGSSFSLNSIVSSFPFMSSWVAELSL